jgi:hypothetical protein
MYLIFYRLYVESNFLSNAFPNIRKNTVLFEGSQASPACPSDKSGIKIKLSMEH